MQRCQLQVAMIVSHTMFLVLSIHVSTQATTTAKSRKSLDGNSAMLQSNVPLFIDSCIKEYMYHLFVEEGEIVLSLRSYKILRETS